MNSRTLFYQGSGNRIIKKAYVSIDIHFYFHYNIVLIEIDGYINSVNN
jgi:hypothetical protein